MTRIRTGHEWTEVVDGKMLLHFPLDQENDEHWRDTYQGQAVVQGVPAGVVGAELVVRLPAGTTPAEGLAVLQLAEILIDLTDARVRLEHSMRSPEDIANELLEKWRQEHQNDHSAAPSLTGQGI